jgi:hypothetical protein
MGHASASVETVRHIPGQPVRRKFSNDPPGKCAQTHGSPADLLPGPAGVPYGGEAVVCAGPAGG